MSYDKVIYKRTDTLLYRQMATANTVHINHSSAAPAMRQVYAPCTGHIGRTSL